jgi:hypothetical protein
MKNLSLNSYKIVKSAWKMSERVAMKLAKHDGNDSYSKSLQLSVFFDAFGAFLKYGVGMYQYEDMEVYNLSKYVRRNIITSRRAVSFLNAMNEDKYVDCMLNKVLFNKTFSKYVKRDWLYSKEMTLEDFKAFCKKHDKAMIKPIDKTWGAGVHCVELPKDEADVAAKFEEIVKDNLLMEEFVKQHDGVMFNRRSVNTLRMYTILDRTGKAHMIKAVLRIGAPDCDVDNYHAGGSMFTLSREYGMVEIPGKTLTDISPVYFLNPGNYKMVGFEVPHYRQAVEAVEEAARLVPHVRFIGWDVAVTPDGVEFIEGNHLANIDMLQLGYCEKNFWHKLKKMI